MEVSNSKLKLIAGQAKSLSIVTLYLLALAFIILGIYLSEAKLSELNSIQSITSLLTNNFMITIGVAMLFLTYLFSKLAILNADMFGYISRKKAKKILENCEIVNVQLINTKTTKKVKRWGLPMTEYSFIIDDDNSKQARFGSFDNNLFQKDNSPSTNIHKNINTNHCKAYWSSAYPHLVIPTFLLEEQSTIITKT